MVTRDNRPIPRATYRLQLNKDFTFSHVAGIAQYLGDLGISHAYLSPILKARPGSTHGYDTVDHTQINPELGSLDDFRDMAATLRTAGVSIILDIVPNHMGVGGDTNHLWMDVLEWGPESPYAEWFDINWRPSEPTLHNRVLVPFLGCPYGRALTDGKLELRFDATQGEFAIWAEAAHKLPLRLADYATILTCCPSLEPRHREAFSRATVADGQPLKQRLARAYIKPDVHSQLEAAVTRLNSAEGRWELGQIIDRQHWRVARSSVAADDINYRRFFIVSDLAAVRIEDDTVFDHVHRIPFQLVGEGLVDGLRVDHIDGLYDPAAYCRRVREKCPRPIYLVVEKILAPHESIHTDWDVDGTTGYEFAATVTRLLTDSEGEDALSEINHRFTGRTESFDEVEQSAKLDIIDYEMAAELDALASRLRSIAIADPETADLTRNALRNGLRAVVASMPVYRTYVDGGEVHQIDGRTVGLAVRKAREMAPSLDPDVFVFVERVMTGDAGPAALETAMRIQQYTGPVMAKGLEDTTLYRYNRLIALSDVGEKPDRFSQSVAAFHDFIRSRLRDQPHGMLTTSSHDTKRGEDVRARIASLSGYADDWAISLADWTSQLEQQGAPELHPNDLYYFFQLLIGAWPFDYAADSEIPPEALERFRERMDAVMLKSIREARLRTNWNVPRTEYEQRVSDFVRLALSSGENSFLKTFRHFEAKVAPSGAHNSLVSTVLKLTVPGVPDIYQGAELWEQSMVDPDNRRPVDFALRQNLLTSQGDLDQLVANFRTGAAKQAVVASLLALRKQSPDLFAYGGYEPLPVGGLDGNRVVAFRRQQGGETLSVLAVLGPWRGAVQAQVQLGGSWHDVLRNQQATLESEAEISTILRGLPVFVGFQAH